MVLLGCFCPFSSGHGWMVSPKPRAVATTNSNTPCENTTPSAGGVYNSGTPMTVSWIHPHSGGNIDIRLAPQSMSTAQANFKSLGTVPYDSPLTAGDASAQVTLPANLPPGRYTVQWEWDSSAYYNCADVVIVPPGSSPVQGDANTYQLPDGKGTVNINSGQITCSSGYTLSSDGTTCVSSGLSPGAAFGIFLLIFVIVSVGVLTGVLIFLKLKRPETYHKFISKLPGRKKHPTTTGV